MTLHTPHKNNVILIENNNTKAWSYTHWQYITTLDNGAVIFNNWNYSVTTRKHQAQARQLLKDHGINIAYDLQYTDCSLDNLEQALTEEIEGIKTEINELRYLMNKKGTRKAKNLERQQQVKGLLFIVQSIENTIVRLQNAS